MSLVKFKKSGEARKEKVRSAKGGEKKRGGLKNRAAGAEKRNLKRKS